MELSVLSTTVKVASAFFLYKLIYFIRFYIQARRSGFPVYVSPVPSRSILWMILAPIVVSHLEKYLPALIYERLDVATPGWEFRRKRELHERLGKVFVLVTIDSCSVW